MVMAARISSDSRDFGAAGLDVIGSGAAGAEIFCAAGAIGLASG